MWAKYNKDIIKDICKNCGSPISAKTYSYLEYLQHILPGEKIYCEIYDDCGFYFATRAKGHARLIEIAVKNNKKGCGVGKKMLFRLLTKLKAENIYKLTFRTPIDEPAQHFWSHMGATVVGLKENDFVMELNFE